MTLDGYSEKSTSLLWYVIRSVNNVARKKRGVRAMR